MLEKFQYNSGAQKIAAKQKKLLLTARDCPTQTKLMFTSTRAKVTPNSPNLSENQNIDAS